VDSASNVSIQGSFIINDYFMQNGFANLIINTNNSVLSGNVITYDPYWSSTSLYISHSLRGNSIGESIIDIDDTTRYVNEDSITWSEYDLIVPYNTEYNYSDVPLQLPITSVAYDNINQVLWSGKPSAIGNNGIV